MKSILVPLIPVVLSYVLLGLCTYIFKKRTPEEYAASAARNPVWFFARWTALWKALGGLGLDPAKVAEGIGQVITGKVMPLAIGVVAAEEKKPSVAPKKVDSEAGPYSDGLAVLLVCGALSLSSSGCTPGARSAEQAVISATSLACIFASAETDAPAVAQICGVAQDLIPIVRQLIGQREAAKRAGVRWSTPDAGTQ